MKVETTRSAAHRRLRHAVAFPGSPAELIGQAVPLLSAAAARGDTVALLVSPGTRAALGAAADGAVDLADVTRPRWPQTISAQTAAVQLARRLRELAGGSGAVTVLSEHDAALDGPDGRYWTEFDAACNAALVDLPVHLTCFFPELPLHPEVVEGALRTHTAVLVEGRLHDNPSFARPRAEAGAVPATVPMLLGPPDVRLRFSAFQLQEVRAVVAAAVGRAPFETDRAEDVVLAVNEIATNAVEHGTREAELAVWADAEGVTCEVHDRGRLGGPLPGLRAPHPAEERGRGVWIARQLCDVLHVWADADGTHVRVRAAP